MPVIQVPNRPDLGIVRDIDAFTLPAGAWSDGLNMLFKDRKASKAFGTEEFLTSLTISPRELFFCPLNEAGFWIYPGLTKIRAFDIDGTTADVTRAAGDYTGTEDRIWYFTYLNGVAILTNNTDLPQYWAPALSNDFAALTNWPAATYAKVMRSFKNFIVALDVTKAAGRFGQLVKWSHPADPNALPASWDETDPTVLAGEFPLTKSVGVAMDCLPLGNTNIVYKEDSVWAMSFVGAPNVFGFNPMFESWGILAANCVVQTGVGKHFVVTREDVLTHNGVQAQSILSERDRKWLFANIEISSYPRCRTIYWANRGEVWFFFGVASSSVPNMAMIWNEQTGSVSFREIPQSRGFAYSYPLILTAGDTWDGETAQQWGSNAEIWDEPSKVAVRQRLFFVNSILDEIHEFNQDIFTDDGASYRSYLERVDLPYIGMDDRGAPVVDLDTVKLVKEVYPRITGTAGATVEVYFALRDDPEAPLTWQQADDFIVGTTDVIGIYQSGRLFSIRFEATDDELFEVHGFSYDVAPLGRF